MRTEQTDSSDDIYDENDIQLLEKVLVVTWLDILNSEFDKKVIYAKDSEIPIVIHIAKRHLNENATVEKLRDILFQRLIALESNQLM
ncbi:hypothetical protein L4D09_12775 [Photobacterium makurazakiensis]|uniref:hypothetical protein n=1 Tax=Photobacterium makurazakiensis TaxID=2910234 RepID=UPI003D0FB661